MKKYLLFFHSPANILFFLVLYFISATSALAQVSPPPPEDGDFKSSDDGSWTQVLKWQVFNEGAWIPATAFPDANARVYIHHAMATEAERAINEIHIMKNGILYIVGNLFVTSDITVNEGGILDFYGFDVVGSGNFSLNNGGSVKITSPEGLRSRNLDFLYVGNVQNSGTIRYFSQTATYWYAGSVPQVTGDIFGSGSTSKNIIIDNTTTVTLTQRTGISAPGKLEIRTGTFIETELFNISGGGYLVMSGGTLQTSASGDIPKLNVAETGITGGTIELNAASEDQNLKNNIYFNLTFSGGNTVTTTGAITDILGTVTITGEATLDVQNRAFGKPETNFTMDGGRFRSSLLNESIPMMDGIYNLTGGTVELYGTDASQTHTLQGGKTYYNVEINAQGANTAEKNVNQGQGGIVILGEMIIYSPAVYQTSSGAILSGPGKFELMPGATLNYGDKNGITSSECGDGTTCGNIRTATRIFPSEANYGLVGGAGSAATGNGLPPLINNLFINRTTDVTLSNDLTLNNEMYVEGSGNLITNDKKIILAENASIQEPGNASILGIVETERTLQANETEYFGGIGLEITAMGNSPGITLVRRVTGAPQTGAGNSGIDRSYTINPSNDDGLDATMVFHYRDGVNELNGIPEGNLVLYRLPDGETDWIAEGGEVNIEGDFIIKDGINSFSTWTAGDSEASLPVDLLAFTGTLQNQQAELRWATASERNNDGFEIQRSVDTKEFETIGFVKGAGTAGERNEYVFIDDDMVQSSFYRLKQVDFDGKSTFSKIVQVMKTDEGNAFFTVSPNPFTHKLDLYFHGKNDENHVYQLQLNSALGKEIARLAGNGEKLNTLINEKLNNADKGVYVLTIYSDRLKSRKRIIKH